MYEDMEIEEMSIEQLQNEIEVLQNEIEEHKAELDEINEKLGETETMEGEAEPVYSEPETPSEEAEQVEDEEIARLKARKEELIELITQKSMKIIALQKRLNDLLADKAIEEYNEEV